MEVVEDMLLDKKPFDQLLGDDVLGLIPGTAEGRRIDYKLELPGDGERDVRNVLADVCALANAAGGYLVYGVQEEKDDAGANTGIPESVVGVGEVNEDRFTLDLQQRINDGIEPRIIGHRARFIPVGDAGKVLIIRIPASLLSPHRVTYRGTRDFYIRHDRGNQLMDLDEIRSAFLDVSTLSERVEEFRRLRTSRILAGDTPIPLLEMCPVFVLHVIPMSHFTKEDGVDVTGVQIRPMHAVAAQVSRARLNADGFLFYSSPDNERERGYVQLFRDGTLEVCSTHAHEPREFNGIPTLASQWLEEGFIDSLRDGLELFSSAGVQPPLYIGLALCRVRGAALARPERLRGFPDLDAIAIDKDTVFSPTVVIEGVGGSPGSILRPAFDSVWQASGFPHSPYYNDDGEWVRG